MDFLLWFLWQPNINKNINKNAGDDEVVYDYVLKKNGISYSKILWHPHCHAHCAIYDVWHFPW